MSIEEASSNKEGPVVFEFSDKDEYSAFKDRGDPVLHIELREIACCLVIAPLSANTLAKMSSGMCDNLLTNVYRCWQFSKDNDSWKVKKPVIVAAAMNT